MLPILLAGLALVLLAMVVAALRCVSRRPDPDADFAADLREHLLRQYDEKDQDR